MWELLSCAQNSLYRTRNQPPNTDTSFKDPPPILLFFEQHFEAQYLGIHTMIQTQNKNNEPCGEKVTTEPRKLSTLRNAFPTSTLVTKRSVVMFYVCLVTKVNLQNQLILFFQHCFDQYECIVLTDLRLMDSHFAGCFSNQFRLLSSRTVTRFKSNQTNWCDPEGSSTTKTAGFHRHSRDPAEEPRQRYLEFTEQTERWILKKRLFFEDLHP